MYVLAVVHLLQLIDWQLCFGIICVLPVGGVIAARPPRTLSLLWLGTTGFRTKGGSVSLANGIQRIELTRWINIKSVCWTFFIIGIQLYKYWIIQKDKERKKTFYEKEYVEYICLLNKGDLGLWEFCSVSSSLCACRFGPTFELGCTLFKRTELTVETPEDV